MAMQKIGILGSGDVGKALGKGFAALGHEVMIGSRDPSKLAQWQQEVGVHARLGVFQEAAQFGDVIILATLWSGTEHALELAGHANLKGKVLIDATNPLLFEPNSLPKLALGHTDSGGEQVQRWLPGTRVVKCFNSVGNAHMFKPDFPHGPPTMFLAGNDADAKATVVKICQDFGWETLDAGGIEASRLLEPLCILWVSYGIRSGGWNHAFKLLKK